MVDMVHTMLIFLRLLDMQHLVLLPCMTIQAQYMEVSTMANMYLCNLLIIIYSCSNYSPSFIGIGGESTRGMGKKIFVGRLPQEASAEDLRQYFGRFGHILDVYVPKVR